MSVRCLVAFVLSAAAAVSAPRSAAAQEFPDNPLIQAGINLYNDMEYESSVDTLQRALVRAESIPEQKVAIFKYLALDYLVLQRTEDAQQAFRQLLAIQPDFQLDPAVFAPEHMQFLEGVRRQWEAEGRPGWVRPEDRLRAATIEHDLPAQATRDQSLDLVASVVDPDNRVRSVVLNYRAAGETAFSRIDVQPAGGGYAATIPGDSIQPPLLEYYFEALDQNGNVVGGRGDARTPLRVPVPGEEEGGVWTEWWFWTIIGVGVAASVAIPVGIVYGGGGSSDPASVTIVLCDPLVETCP
jgi:tetratricopeptide (TPR) repeat protein